MAEYIMAMVIIFLVALVMIGIGVSQIKSKKPVAFYTGEKAPGEDELSDVAAWNKRHGFMWVIYGLAIMEAFLLSSLVKSEILQMVILLGGIVGALPIMILYHSHLKKKYYKER